MTTDKTATRPEPHAFVPPEPGTRDASFGWCAREGCGQAAHTYVHASEVERAAFDAQGGEEAVRDRQALAQDHREWFGYLTTLNCEAVTDRIRRMIAGKKYTWVASLSPALAGERAHHHAPDVRTGQEADKIEAKLLPIESDPARPMAHVMVCDTYGVWSIDSRHASQQEARDDKPERRTYLHFERDRWGNRLTIEHYAISGNHLWWTIAVENSGW